MFQARANAFREMLLRGAIQYAFEQSLVEYANAPALDELGVLVGVSRLGAAPASCTVRFSLVAGHGAVVIPAGTRVSTTDGAAIFATSVSTPVAVGVAFVDIVCEATANGAFANGYAVGTVSVIQDPLAYVSTASNINASAGGADLETDDQLRERIKLAPASFSVAGPFGAYRYWARTANANIIDVAVVTGVPGTVLIYPLMNDGQPTPQQVLDDVAGACSAEDRRPLCDTVVVSSPTRVDYTLEVELTLYYTADAATVLAAVESALQTLVDSLRTRLGRDVIDTQIVAAAQIAGVYRVNLVGFSNITIAPTEFPYCTSLAVSVVGFTAG